MRRLFLPSLFVLCYSLFVFAQERGPTPASPEQIRAAIDKLADVDYDTRMKAGRTIRRAPSAQVVPALLQAVSEHADGFVRFKALIMLTGYTDPRTADAMETALYNGVLAGLSLDGQTYFYQNPLEDRGSHRRQPWFGCVRCT